jgi:hypothetical protein
MMHNFRLLWMTQLTMRIQFQIQLFALNQNVSSTVIFMKPTFPIPYSALQSMKSVTTWPTNVFLSIFRLAQPPLHNSRAQSPSPHKVSMRRAARPLALLRRYLILSAYVYCVMFTNTHTRCSLDIALNIPYVIIRYYRTYDNDDVSTSTHIQNTDQHLSMLWTVVTLTSYLCYYLQYSINILYLCLLTPLIRDEVARPTTV